MVCRSVTPISLVQAAEPIVMPFVVNLVVPKEPCSRWQTVKGQYFEGEKGSVQDIPGGRYTQSDSPGGQNRYGVDVD